MKKALKDCTVLVTPTSFGKSDSSMKEELAAKVGKVVYNTTGKPLKADDLIKIIPDIDGYIAGLDEITAEVLDKAENLQIIARYGVGVDRVDLDAAKQKDILVTNTPGANSSSVAELSVTLMLMLSRKLPEALSRTQSGEWPRINTTGLYNRTVGLLGFGAIGRQTAEMLKPFGCKILVFDPYVDASAAADLGVEIVTLEELQSKSDYLSLHAPVTESTRGMLNEAFFAAMKDGAFLVNTARGELIDDAALEAALESGKLAGAALDVFSSEPPGADHFIFKYPQVIVTPHMSAHTEAAVNAMGRMALDSCLAVLQGQTPQFIVNK